MYITYTFILSCLTYFCVLGCVIYVLDIQLKLYIFLLSNILKREIDNH